MDNITIAIVGSETLLGREVRELLRGGEIEASVTLVASSEGESKLLTEDDAEAVVMADLQSDAVTDADVVVLCGSPASSRRTLELIRKAGTLAQIVDATGALEDEPAALLRAPLAVSEPIERTEGAIDVIAHPAAIALARFFSRLSETAAPGRAVVTVYEPASERGQRGLDELQQQTVGLLSFKPLNKDVYDAQVSFNMLAAWGEDAPESLASVEERIDRNLATLLRTGQLPSLRLIQAPVFHGYSMSIWAEFENAPNLSDLGAPDIDVREEPPTNVGVAGQGGITLGPIAPDRNNPRAYWFWMVADNLRITAENAVEVLRELL
ncbi:MAG TPA: Asd/ArgC dimerization domain-containing protein [Bryobacteraceae bacterium]|nr:Asd/ArgC dimerization domain-containing protein [Bryobacteraceae bacterium]